MSLTQALGHKVSGSDAATTGHDAANINGANMLVFSGAVRNTNPELTAAEKLGIPLVERSEYLAAIADGYDETVAIAGTHGKTTVTAMVATALGSLSPTVHIGADMELSGNSKRLFVTEACEYRRSVLALSPTLLVVLNAELDHTDCYSSEREVAEVFAAAAQKSKRVLYCGDDRLLRSVMPAGALTFGEDKNNDFRVVNLRFDGENRCSFSLSAMGISLGSVRLRVKGRHNALNAAAALSVALLHKVPFSVAASALSSFDGVPRRIQLLGCVGKTQIYTDYAHHPTEVAATIRALSSDQKLLVVFEPHTFSRAKAFAQQFATALSGADGVILAPIFASREDANGFSSHDLCSVVHKYIPCRSFDSYEHICTFLHSVSADYGCIVFMGAGSIDKCAHLFLSSEQQSV